MYLDGIGHVEALGAPSAQEMAVLQAQAAAEAAAKAAARGAGDAAFKQAQEAGLPAGPAVDAARQASDAAYRQTLETAWARMPAAPAGPNLKTWLVIGAVGVGVYLLVRRPAPSPYYRRASR